MIAKGEVVLEVKDMCKNFGVTIALNHVNFTLKSGEVRGLIGENGSGKSTVSSIVPGMQDLANMVSPLLQTGEYDVVVGTTDIYGSLSIAIDEVEKALGKNIHMISRSAFSKTVDGAFNAKDSTGNTIMDAMVSVGLYEFVAGVIVLRNCLDGYAENMRDGGVCSRIAGQRPLVVTTPEQYNALADESIPYSYVSVEQIVDLCNSTTTWQDIDSFGASLTSDAIISYFSK